MGQIGAKTTSVSEVEESTKGFIKVENAGGPGFVSHDVSDKQEAPDRKKVRSLSLEEYEAALDQDTTFQDIDLDFKESALS